MAKKIKVNEAAEVKLSLLAEEFIAEKEALGRSPDTIRHYQETFKKFFSLFDENITSFDITKQLIINFQKQLNNGSVGKETINHHLRAIRTFVNWCYENNYITNKIKIQLVKGQDSVKEVYSNDELALLLEHPRVRDGFNEWRNWAVINWLLGTGNRASSVVAVRMKDIDLQAREITIAVQKNKKVSVIPMDETLRSVLIEYIKRCRNTAKPDSYLFPNVFDEQLNTNGLRQAIIEYNHKRGVKRTSIHAFRHTFAKLYIMNGGELVRLQKILGHSSLEMSRHYVNLFGTDLKQGYNNVSPLVNLMKEQTSQKKKIKKR